MKASKLSPFISDIIIFFVSVLFIMLCNLAAHRALYIEAYDANLYLSIADNFLETGHFLQTARPFRADMIVPPGLPAICTLLLAVTRSVAGIVAFQYILFGLTAVLLTRAATFIWSGPRYVKYFTMALFLWASLHIGAPNPAYVLTETHVVFLTALVLFLFLHPSLSPARKVCWIVPLLFVQLLIRPACSGVLIISLIVMLFFVLKKQVTVFRLVGYLLVFALVLAGNTALNYRETGHIVMLENYGATDVCLANNPNTKATWYLSDDYENFADEEILQVHNDNTLTSHEKNSLLNAKLKAFVREHPLFVLKNAVIKYLKLFCHSLGMEFYLAFIALAVFWWKKLLSKWQALLYLAAFLITTIVPAFGLLVLRYAAPALPFYIVLDGAFACYIGDLLCRPSGPERSSK